MLRLLEANLSKRSAEKKQRASAKESERSAAAVRQQCKTLSASVREAWRHIPELATVDYVHNWHIDLICAHLEAMASGKMLDLGLENRLQINIPPGTLKSFLVSVFFPAWLWGPMGQPNLQFITTTFRVEDCNRDTRRMRDLVLSEWFQTLWPHVKLVAKGDSRISTSVGGWRHGLPFTSIMGKRADYILIDDPHSVKTAESEADRQRVLREFRETIPFRLNHPKRSSIVVIMQRLHVSDICGAIDQLKLPYTKLILPMEFEPERRCVTPIGRDPRKQDGELLFPAYVTREMIARDKASLSDVAIAGQLQQRPFPRGGSMFKRSWFDFAPAAPLGTRWVRHWDLAGSKRRGSGLGQAWTAGVRLGRGPDGTYYVGHCIRIQDEGDEVRRTIYATARMDGLDVEISLPQDPGQAGKVQAKDMVKMLDGFLVRAEKESGDKQTRAEPFQAQAAQGNVKLVKTGDPARDAWIEAYLDEIVAFPGSPTMDQVDATSGAYAALQRMRAGFSRYGDLGGLPVAISKAELGDELH